LHIISLANLSIRILIPSAFSRVWVDIRRSRFWTIESTWCSGSNRLHQDMCVSHFRHHS
jgi:hypothetical protein